MDTMDLIVIGGGPAGYLAAERAAASGLQVMLFEEKALGGVCLNEGCIPTKTMLNSAKIYYHALHGEAFGVHAKELMLVQKEVLERKNKVVKTLVSGVTMTMRKNKITVRNEKAILKEKTDNGFLVKANEECFEAKNILIATGSKTVIPPIPGVLEGLESGVIVTSRELLNMEECPKRLAIVGAGVIGLEMAAYYSAIGSQVTVIEMLPKIAGPTESEVSAILKKELEKKGVTFLLEYRVTKVTGHSLICEKKEAQMVVEADAILLSIGRKPVTEGLGLEAMGVWIERGAIVTDEYLQTSVNGIYAAGDVNGKIMLAHTAYRESEVAVNHMLGIEDAMSYDKIPSVIYTFPEVAGIGETEESAKEKGKNVKSVKLPMQYSGRYVAEQEGEAGICKLIVDMDKNCIIGAHLIGGSVSEMIWGVAAVMEQETSIEELKKIVFPHPTVSEIIKETIFRV